MRKSADAAARALQEQLFGRARDEAKAAMQRSDEHYVNAQEPKLQKRLPRREPSEVERWTRSR